MVTGGPNAEIRGVSQGTDIVNASKAVKWKNGALTAYGHKQGTEVE